MTGFEFVIVLAWLLLPPLAVAIVVLVGLHFKAVGRAASTTVEATLLLVAVSAGISILMLNVSPVGIGSFIGVRDTPVMWAPFAFLAVLLALPLAVWWASRRSRKP